MMKDALTFGGRSLLEEESGAQTPIPFEICGGSQVQNRHDLKKDIERRVVGQPHQAQWYSDAESSTIIFSNQSSTEAKIRRELFARADGIVEMPQVIQV